MLSDQPGDISERPLSLSEFFDSVFNDINKQVGYKSTPHLNLNCIFAVSQEIMELEILLDSPEEDFNIPSAFIDLCNGKWAVLQVVGEKKKFPFSALIVKAD